MTVGLLIDNTGNVRNLSEAAGIGRAGLRTMAPDSGEITRAAAGRMAFCALEDVSPIG
ncbi:MAG: hypothetical protein LBS06_01415 [Treponema sp.]|nr:hypothetical protein [Treponema sp.]